MQMIDARPNVNKAHMVKVGVVFKIDPDDIIKSGKPIEHAIDVLYAGAKPQLIHTAEQIVANYKQKARIDKS